MATHKFSLENSEILELIIYIPTTEHTKWPEFHHMCLPDGTPYPKALKTKGGRLKVENVLSGNVNPRLVFPL